jgi:hypothetical protein
MPSEMYYEANSLFREIQGKFTERLIKIPDVGGVLRISVFM